MKENQIDKEKGKLESLEGKLSLSLFGSVFTSPLRHPSIFCLLSMLVLNKKVEFLIQLEET